MHKARTGAAELRQVGEVDIRRRAEGADTRQAGADIHQVGTEGIHQVGIHTVVLTMEGITTDPMVITAEASG